MDISSITDADWAGSPSDRRSTTGYCTFMGGNLVTYKSKKQTVVARSSAEAGSTRQWLILLVSWHGYNIFFKRLGFQLLLQSYCFMITRAALHIASNLVFHERTKYIEVDCHFIQDKILDGIYQQKLWCLKTS